MVKTLRHAHEGRHVGGLEPRHKVGDAFGIEAVVLHIDDNVVYACSLEDLGDASRAELHDHVPARHTALGEDALEAILTFTAATLLLCLSALVPVIPARSMAIAALMLVNFAIGIWISMDLTMAQEVSEANVSTAAGLLGGSGSLAGALAMWWVGKITQQTGSFAPPMAAVSVAAVLAAVAGLSCHITDCV